MAPKTITIAGSQFEISQPFEEGHTLTAAEAKALNQVRAENIRNNMAKAVKNAESADEAAKTVAEYDKEYTFTLATVGASRTMDPVEREARSIARDGIKAKLAETGRKLKDVDPEALEAKIEEVAARPEVLKIAKKRVEDKKKAVDAASIDLGAAA